MADIRYPPWDPKARLRICDTCPYCRAGCEDGCGCPCHEDDA